MSTLEEDDNYLLNFKLRPNLRPKNTQTQLSDVSSINPTPRERVLHGAKLPSAGLMSS